MSETTYVPRAGSKAEAAIEALKSNVWMSTAELADAIEVDKFAVHGYVQTAINHGAVRKVTKDGEAGFMLAETATPPNGEEENLPARRAKTSEKKPAKRAAPARATAEPPLNNHPVSAGHAVGILECGTVVIVDTLGHAMSLSPGIARRVAELVTRTA